MKHEINHEKFKGPITVLYDLIEERKLSVSEFSLVEITESFLDFVKSLDGIDKEEVSQFIVVSSLLILLKSKTLIPELELTEDENRDLQILENQIKAFEILKNQTKVVKDIWNKNILVGGSVDFKSFDKIFVPDRNMDLEYFSKYINERLLEIAPKEEEKKEVRVHKTVKIEDALTHVRNVIKRIKTLNFRNITEGGDDRLKEKNKRNVVILFIAVLELVKMGEIDVVQENNFSDILVLDNN